MSNEIIESVAYDNYDDFQHVNLIFSQIRIKIIILKNINSVSLHDML
jgi:hypothetical protein